MASTHRETEITYLAPGGADVPDLAALPGVGGLGAPHQTHLRATYYDTPTASLARRDITLRRRTGGADAGWTLKTPGPGPDDRLEHRVASRAPEATNGAEPVPDELVEAVRAYVRTGALAPIAAIETRRIERTLLGLDHDELAVVADDAVESRGPDDGPTGGLTWREVEVELIDGSPDLLDACRGVFREAGLERSPFASKLHHAIGDDTTSPALPARDGTVGALALRHLADQLRELLARDHDARTDEPDGVHKMRVATRRLRSALATYRPVFDRTVTDPLRDELKWLGGVLGAARDLEVLRARIRSHADALPVELLMGPVIQRVDVELGSRHVEAHARLRDALDTPRYFALLDGLDALLDDPPFSDRASRPADEAARLVVNSVQRVRRAARQVRRADDENARNAALHEVRKDAKRARYAAESAEPALGKRGRRLAEAMEELQEVLGEVQDTVASRRLLRELGVLAHLANENGFSFGLLYGDEARIAEAQLRGYDRALNRARRAAKRL